MLCPVASFGPAPLTAHVDRDGASVTVVLHGELDLAGGGLLRPLVAELVRERPETIVIDLAGLGFMDSSGLSALLQVARAVDEAGIRLVSRAPQGSEARVLMQVTGTEGLLRLER